MLGEAGVGKSRLGRELLARHHDVTGIVAQAYPLASSAAFGLWIEALDRVLRDLPDDEVVEMCGGLLDDLREPLPSRRARARIGARARPSAGDFGHAVSRDPDGGIIAAGSTANGGDNEFALMPAFF
jgi:hypothetical protein